MTKYTLSEIMVINKNLIELQNCGFQFPFLISKLLSDNLDKTNVILNSVLPTINDDNYSQLMLEEFEGIEPIYLRDIRLGDVRNIHIDLRTMSLLKVLIK
jgi:hypothetical protein